MARVLVTGGTGFIGRHLVAALFRRGDRVRCLIHRRGKNIAGAECPRGDLTVPASLAGLVRDVDVVYHLAGATLVASPHWYQPINSLGTRNLGLACADLARPPVMVFLSSLAAAGPTAPGRPRREEEPPAPVSEYGRSKLRAEWFLRQLAGRLAVTVVRPPSVIGPGDVNTLPLFKAARLGVNFVPGSVHQQLGFIYVDDLVQALLEAAERGERLRGHEAGWDDPRGTYFVATDEFPTLAEVGQCAGTTVGCARVRSLAIPAWMGQFIGRAHDLLARITMRPLLLTSDKMREALAGSWICSSDKAKHDWGFACRTGLADGFRKTVQWYREQGWL